MYAPFDIAICYSNFIIVNICALKKENSLTFSSRSTSHLPFLFGSDDAKILDFADEGHYDVIHTGDARRQRTIEW